MATKYWIGGAAAVAQVHTGSIDSVDGTPADNTFIVTIGGVAISVVGDTDVATTATALRAALNASSHPYFSGITWSGTSGDIIGTADVAGVPFEAALTETGAGTGAVTDFAETTASEGPNDWSTPENWSDSAVPAAADVVILANNADTICYGLDQNTIDLTRLEVEHTFTGKLGLPSHKFATSVDGETFNTDVQEYREQYLKIGADVVNIGQYNSVTQPSGSGRIKVNNDKAGASINTVYRTALTPTDTGFAAVQFLAGNAGADYYIREARGGVAFALGGPGETGTVGDIYVTAQDTNSRVFIGNGLTYTNYTQRGGACTINAAATVTAVSADGGTLTIEGDFTITTLNVNGGQVFDNHVKSSGNAVTTANLTRGTLNLTRSSEPRTIATLNPDGGTLITDNEYITITTLDKPAGPVSMTVSQN